MIGTAQAVPFFVASLAHPDRYFRASPRRPGYSGEGKIAALPGLGHHSRGGWLMLETQSRTPLNETRIWDYISFAILVLLSVLAYSWLVPH